MKQKTMQPPAVYVLVVGLTMEESEYDLGESVLIRRLEKPLTVFDLAAAGTAGFKEWALLEPMVQSATIEIVSSESEAKKPGFDALNKCWLASALMVLRGLNRHICPAVSRYSWNTIAGFQLRNADSFKQQMREEGPKSAVYNPRKKLPPFEGNLLDYHLKKLVTVKNKDQVLDSNEVKWIQKNIKIFNNLAAKSEKFNFGLQAAVDWRYSKDARTAISRLWSGIESILGINQELSFRISLFSSAIMSERGQERVAMYKDIKSLYDLRSKAVHGTHIKEEALLKGVGGSYELLRKLLLDAVSNGSIRTADEWLSLLLA